MNKSSDTKLSNNSEGCDDSDLNLATAIPQSTPSTPIRQTASGSAQNPDLNSLPPNQALALFQQNPVGFIQRIVGDAAQYHLAMLKEQAELDGAVQAFQKTHPDFQRFQQFILQEAADLLQNYDSVATGSWPQILEKAMENFKQKFTQSIQDNQSSGAGASQNPPYMEGSANRSTMEMPASFTREQIGKMSMQDFLKNEAAINDALKNNRIR